MEDAVPTPVQAPSREWPSATTTPAAAPVSNPASKVVSPEIKVVPALKFIAAVVPPICVPPVR